MPLPATIIARTKKAKDSYGAVRAAAGRGCRKDPMPVGTVVIRRRSSTSHGNQKRLVRFIKVRSDGPPGRRWILFARWWWEENRGPVPEGQFVIHQDGDELNDAPDNLILGTHDLRIRLAHDRDPEWSRKQHQRAAAGCAEFNRLAGRLRRLRAPLKNAWYPVLDAVKVILNIPFRKRKPLLRWFGADVDGIPKNGHGPAVRRAIAAAGVRPVRAEDLGAKDLRDYVRVDPGARVATGTVKRKSHELRIALLLGTRVWELAEKAAELPPKARK